MWKLPTLGSLTNKKRTERQLFYMKTLKNANLHLEVVWISPRSSTTFRQCLQRWADLHFSPSSCKIYVSIYLYLSVCIYLSVASKRQLCRTFAHCFTACEQKAFKRFTTLSFFVSLLDQQQSANTYSWWVHSLVHPLLHPSPAPALSPSHFLFSFHCGTCGSFHPYNEVLKADWVIKALFCLSLKYVWCF